MGDINAKPIKLRSGWYREDFAEGFDADSAGIYEWRVENIGIYVGKAKVLRKRVRAYANNVRRMIEGKDWHSDPKKDYRPIHYALRRAHDEGLNVSVSILENCDPTIRAERERFWEQQRRNEEIAGGPAVLNSDRRRGKNKTAYLQVGIWFNEDTKHIHIASSEGGGFISTVCNDPSSKRGNPNLYGKLAKVLRANGLPCPDTPAA